MLSTINYSVGILLTIIFELGMISYYLVHHKYNRMFETMANRGRDKHLLMIERDYRHEYLRERGNRPELFAEREYYQIKVGKIPIYLLEEFAFSASYFVTALGIAFSLILLALHNTVSPMHFIPIFYLGIEGLVFGILLKLVGTLFNLKIKREQFIYKLFEYLGYELQLFDEAEHDEEGHLFFHKNYKEDKKTAPDHNCLDKVVELRSNGIFDIPDDRGKDKESVVKFDDVDLVQVLDEIFG